MPSARSTRAPRRPGTRAVRARMLAVALVIGLCATSFAVLVSSGPPNAGTPSSQGRAVREAPSGAAAPGAPQFHLESLPLLPSSSARPNYYGGPEGWLAFDPNDQSFWVANSNYGSVEVIPVSSIANYSMQVSHQYNVGLGAFAVAVDNSTGIVAVTDSGSNEVSLISGPLGQVVGSPSVGLSPKGVAFDVQTHRAYVANSGSDNVTVVSETSGRSVANITVGSAPFGVAYDPTDQEIFVADSGSNNVSIISVGSNQVVGTVRVGTDPIGVAWDSRNDTILVTNNGSQNISILSGANNSIAGTITVNDTSVLEGIAYDSGLDEVWVGAGWDYLVEASPTSGSATTFIAVDPSGVAYDPAGWICFTNSLNRTFECLNASSPIPPPTYRVAFSGNGLPAGTNWSVFVSLETPVWYCGLEPCYWGDSSSASTINFQLPNGTFDYRAEEDGSPYANATGTMQVDGQGLAFNVSFGSSATPYAVAFHESGLPAASTWDVEMYAGSTVSSNTSSITVLEPNGTYAYTIPDSGSYSASPSAGTFTVNGRSVNLSITFYPNNGGGNRSLTRFLVTFDETGLPSHTHWGIAIGGNLSETTGISVQFLLTNGTYGYAALPVPGYRPNDSGIFAVSGRNETLLVNYSVPTFPWILIEFGLANGTLWHASVINATGANVTKSTNGTTILFYLPNGTYEVNVWANGYFANLSITALSISGNSSSGTPNSAFQPVYFGENPPAMPVKPGSGTSSGAGLPAAALGGIAFAALGIAAVGLGTAAYVRRQWRKEGEEIVATLQSLDEDPWRAPGK